MNQPIHLPLRPLRRLGVAALLCGAFSLPQAANNIPDTPLQAGTSADPNVMMILDDSGSMHFEIMPDDYTLSAPGQWVWNRNTGWQWVGGTAYYVFPRADNVYGPSDYTNAVVTVDWSNPYARMARSPQINSVYYNPSVTYTPWSPNGNQTFGDANPTCAPHNPMIQGVPGNDATCRNLTVNNNNFNNNSWIACTAANNCTADVVPRSFWPATYFRYNGGNIWNTANYTQVTIQSGSSYSGEGRSNRTDCTNGVCTGDQEMKNFANWYTYYRSRVLTARAGIGRAFFSQGTGLRVGFGAINKASARIDGASDSLGTIITGVRQFSGTDRNNFFDNLYTHSIPAQGTPLRRALDDVGQYYSRSDDKGPWSSTPGFAGGTKLACRQSYTILMTDGYWNGDAANTATGNQDGSNGPLHTGPNNQSGQFISRSPFADNYSGTLADVAAYYWKNDLSALPNAVPTSSRDPAFWQHMVTFGVGLGVQGSVTPATAFAAIDNTGQTLTWPNNPSSSNPGKIDDLLHAAVNSRGDFFSAQNPVEFANALTAMLNDIVDRKSSSASVSTNSTKLTTSSLVFSATFNTNKWTGELEAFAIDSSGVSSTAKWKASEKVPAHGSRKIITTTGGQAREFLWSNLSATDQSALGSTDVVSFIRGDRSKEVANGGTLRNRGSVLGDIIHSSPYYSKDSKIVLVGANDGMLHAFDADTGVEKFAYIPSPLLAKLAQLSQTTYDHKYYVDGEITVGEKSQTFLNESYAVATLGRGGKGLFALDITDPANFGTTDVVWEYVSTTDKDLGYMLGKPVIARMNDDSTVAIVGNGYNSTNGNSVLYIFDLKTGALLSKISTNVGGDNGLAAPGVYDADADGYVDYIYAGDLKGNVWKFDVTGNNKNKWKLDNGGAPIFVAKDAAGNLQPITSQITMARNFLRNDPNLGKLFLFFGTGAYFRADDPASKAVQSWYGIIDDGLTISSRNVLKQRGLESVFTVEGKTVRSFKPANIVFDNQGNLVSHDMNGERGWYIDWIDPDGTERGERIITPSAFYRFTEPVLLVSSIVPVADDPCQPGGTGYLNAINAFTGGSLNESFFIFGSYTGATAIGSLDMDLGMLSQASILVGDSSTGQLVVSGSGKTGATDEQTTGSTKVNTGVQPRGRMSWREIRK